MAAESNRIGLGSCPVCASPKAHYTVSKKQLVCVTCNSCNFQGFARSDRSDELLRAKIIPAQPPESVSPPTPVAAAVQAGRQPEPEPVAQPVIHAPKPKARSFMSW